MLWGCLFSLLFFSLLSLLLSPPFSSIHVFLLNKYHMDQRSQSWQYLTCQRWNENIIFPVFKDIAYKAETHFKYKDTLSLWRRISNKTPVSMDLFILSIFFLFTSIPSNFRKLCAFSDWWMRVSAAYVCAFICFLCVHECGITKGAFSICPQCRSTLHNFINHACPGHIYIYTCMQPHSHTE